MTQRMLTYIITAVPLLIRQIVEQCSYHFLLVQPDLLDLVGPTGGTGYGYTAAGMSGMTLVMREYFGESLLLGRTLELGAIFGVTGATGPTGSTGATGNTGTQ